MWTKTWWLLLHLRKNRYTSFNLWYHMSVNSNMFSNFPTCQDFLNFSDHIVRLIINLDRRMGQAHHVKCLGPGFGGQTATLFDCCLPVTVQSQKKSFINDQIIQQNSNEWCHMCHRHSCQGSWWISLNDDRDAEFIHGSTCITLLTDHVHMIEIHNIVYLTLWKLRTWSWIWKHAEVGQW